MHGWMDKTRRIEQFFTSSTKNKGNTSTKEKKLTSKTKDPKSCREKMKSEIKSSLTINNVQYVDIQRNYFLDLLPCTRMVALKEQSYVDIRSTASPCCIAFLTWWQAGELSICRTLLPPMDGWVDQWTDWANGQMNRLMTSIALTCCSRYSSHF